MVLQNDQDHGRSVHQGAVHPGWPSRPRAGRGLGRNRRPYRVVVSGRHHQNLEQPEGVVQQAHDSEGPPRVGVRSRSRRRGLAHTDRRHVPDGHNDVPFPSRHHFLPCAPSLLVVVRVVYSVAFTKEGNGRRVITGGHDRCICVWNSMTGTLHARQFVDPQVCVGVACSSRSLLLG